MPGQEGARRGPMRFGAVRRRAARLMRELDVAPPLDVRDVCERLAHRRGRPIRLVEHTFPQAATFGLWIGTTTEDLVVVERETTPAHQRHIVLHEIGHIVLDHGADFGLEALSRELTPTVGSGVARRALRRSAYDSASERDAEQFASVITAWAGEVGGAASSESADELARAYDYRWVWR